MGKFVGKRFSTRMLILQYRVLRFGLFQDGDVGVGGSAECEPTTDCRYPLAALPEPERSALRR